MRIVTTIGLFCAAFTLAGAQAAQASVFIDEYMYNGKGTGSIGEFVEIINTGPASQDMTGWSFDDSSETPGSQSLSDFGTLGVGETAILTDMTADEFRTDWSLDSSVKVIGGNTNNLGRSDEINIYDASNDLVDRLTYNDQAGLGPRTNNVSANILPANFGANDAAAAVLSVVGDQFGSRTSSLGEIGNPGPVPEPTSLCLAGAAAALLIRRRRRA